MRVIAFGGLGRSGKTTAAHCFAEYSLTLDYAAPIFLRFAGPIKEAHAVVCGPRKNDENLYRFFCQTIGDMMRQPEACPGSTGPNFWIDKLTDELLDIASKEQSAYKYESLPLWNLEGKWRERVVLIDDLRYINEVTALKEFNPSLVFIDAIQRLDNKAEWRGHASERMAYEYTANLLPEDTFTHGIANNKVSLDNFKHRCRVCAEQVLCAAE